MEKRRTERGRAPHESPEPRRIVPAYRLRDRQPGTDDRKRRPRPARNAVSDRSLADHSYIVRSNAARHREHDSTAPTKTATPTGTAVPVSAVDSGRVVTITDDFGETVTIRGTPTRIVSLAPSNTEILFALGLGDRVIGVTDYCNYPPEALDKPKVGGYSTINMEKVIAAKPDLVLASFGNTEDVVTHLCSLGMTGVSLNPLTVNDVLHDIELVGEVTGQTAQAAALVDGLNTRIHAITEKTEDLPEKPTVAHIVWYNPLWVSGNGTFQDEVISMAGGTNAFASVEGWSIVSLEEFITTDPDYIFVSLGYAAWAIPAMISSMIIS